MLTAAVATPNWSGVHSRVPRCTSTATPVSAKHGTLEAADLKAVIGSSRQHDFLADVVDACDEEEKMDEAEAADAQYFERPTTPAFTFASGARMEQ